MHSERSVGGGLSANLSGHSVDSRLRQSLAREGMSFHYVLRIVSGEFGGNDFVSIKWDVVVEGSWAVEWGVPTGVTHAANSSESVSNVACFDFIQKFTLRTTNLQNFPQVLFIIYGMDFMGRPVVLGYGQTHLPFHEGKTKKQVRLFSPQPSSSLVGLFGSIFGKRPEYVDPAKTLLKSHGRKYTTVAPLGNLEVEVELVANGPAENGFNCKPASKGS